MSETKQIHIDIPIDLHTRISAIAGPGRLSRLTRKLYRSFLKNMDIEGAGVDVAEKWLEEEGD